MATPTAVGPGRFPAAAVATVTIAGQSRSVSGREAAMLAEFLIYLAYIEALEYGTVAFDVKPGQVVLRVVRTFPPVRLADAPLRP